MQPAGFDDKFLRNLGKVDPGQVQHYLARLLAQKQFLQTLFDHLEEGVIVTNPLLTMVFINRRARLMLRWPRGRNYVGENLLERLSPEHPIHRCLAELRGAIREIDSFECAYGSQGGRTLSLSTLPMRAPLNEAGEPAAEDLLIVLLNDVTERHRRQAEQGRARRLASLATLTSGIAHEIKNPLNSLNIHAQLLRGEVQQARRQGRGPDPAKTERACDVILEESARLTRIVEDFIQAARPRTPRLEERPLRVVIEGLERVFRPECERQGIELEVSLDPTLPPLMMDEHLMTQALRNLIRNAIEAIGDRQDAARRDGEEFVPRIWIHAGMEEDHVNLVVGDNGPGIAESALEHLFEPYNTTKFGGSGLGLMVVYRIVSEHRGALHVDTSPGEGTRFILSLPLGRRPVRLLETQPGQPPISRKDLAP